jgi:hypothetical protein
MAERKEKSDKTEDIVKDAKEAFADMEDHWADNHREALDDIEFSRMGKQWPEGIRKQRELEGRPCLTINKMPSFIRQVVNDARQNKPSIKVHPVDGGADKKTANIFNGLIRNIEYTSSADVAYDTATEGAVSGGFGYFRIGLDYAHDDGFHLDLSIDRISNPFSVYGDPASTAADSSDWNQAFITQMVPKAEFKKRWPDATQIDFDADGWKNLQDPWVTENSVMVAEWWRREEYEKDIYLLSDGSVQSEAAMQEMGPIWAASGIQVMEKRKTKCFRVWQHTLSGAEELGKQDWVGKYIPIVPVYGDEVDVEGKRYFRSLIRDAKDAQRMYNYWRSTETELVALAPKTPFIGPKGAFKTDAAKWATANTQSHAYIEHDGSIAPQRQPFVGVPAGAAHEALTASDDMKAIMGIYDASLGQRSNETSGRAIMARQREGDVATFHFQDNMARAIRHAGRILIDLIPHVYDKPRMVRVIGEDGTQESVKIGPNPQAQQPHTESEEQDQGKSDDPTAQVYDLTAGKYDLTVSTGPSFTTRRQEAAFEMTEMIRAFPDAAPVIGDLLAKNLDWPGADEIAERLKKINPALKGDGLPPMIAQQMQEGMAKIQELEQANLKLEADNVVLKAKADLAATKVEGMKVQTEIADAVGQLQPQQPNPMQQLEFRSKELGVRKQEVDLEQGERANSDDARLSAIENAIAQMHQMMAQQVVQDAQEIEGRDAQLVSAITQGFAAAMAPVAQAMLVPKRVVKGKNNEIIGVEPMTH